MCALRALSLCLKIMALLTLVFGIGSWAIVALAGFLAPAAVQSNPTMNDLTMHTFDLMPNVPTGIPEFDQSMAEFRNLGRMEIPVRETVSLFGVTMGVLGLFQIVGSAITALIFWVIAVFLDRSVRRWEWEDSYTSAPPVTQSSRGLPPPQRYTRPVHGVWDHPAPPKRVWTPKEPYSYEPTPLDLYLKRKGRK